MVDNLIRLLILFIKLSAFSFGGGYAMIPIMLQEAEKYGWTQYLNLSDIIALAGMVPGPIAINSSVGLGYSVAGFWGVVVAFLGITIPCAIIVIIVALFFSKIYKNEHVQKVLYGLRSVIPSIILFAAVSIGLKNGMILSTIDNLLPTGLNLSLGNVNILEIKSITIAVLTFLLLLKTKVHPALILLGAGLTGLMIF